MSLEISFFLVGAINNSLYKCFPYPMNVGRLMNIGLTNVGLSDECKSV